ncbi:MAG: ABC transporter permease [Spirochaetales bacterium]|uniref:ABC transporter permease n=1 Tax=Candidatus Thalassospirochaeta sargassi TaxID=3119039 RepID=A0AAJ1MPD7_9SPIO|nr:ABC transporter permease [Spirochaetales bacterium]
MKQLTRKSIGEFASKNTGYVTFAAMVVILGVLTGGGSLRLLSWQNLAIAEAVRALAALGVGIIIITKGIDLSLGQVVGLCACVSASLAQTPDYVSSLYPGLNLPVIAPILAGVGVGALFGLLNGFLVAYGKLPPFIATLGTMTIAAGLQLIYTHASTVGSLKNEYKVIAQGFLGPIPNMVIYVAIAVLFLWVLMNHTKIGKRIYAIGGNPTAARVSGISVKFETMKVYLMAGVLYGIAGVLLSSRLGLANALTGDNMELDAIAAATVGGVSHSGGVGKVGGIVVGVLTLGLINFGMTYLGVDSYYQLLVKGFIIIAAVYLDMRRAA